MIIKYGFFKLVCQTQSHNLKWRSSLFNKRNVKRIGMLWEDKCSLIFKIHAFLSPMDDPSLAWCPFPPSHELSCFPRAQVVYLTHLPLFHQKSQRTLPQEVHSRPLLRRERWEMGDGANFIINGHGHKEGKDWLEDEAKERKASEINYLSSRETNKLARRREWVSTWINFMSFIGSAQLKPDSCT